MIGFMVSVLRLPIQWRIWVGLLVLFNLVVPLAFYQHLEAQLTIASMVAGSLAQSHLHSKFGFVKLLGVGHVFWVPLVAWLVWRADSIDFQTLFGAWIAGLVVINTVSLVIDFVDVIRFALGERTPMPSN